MRIPRFHPSARASPSGEANIDAINREADRIRQERHQHCEPDLEHVEAEFEKLCRSEIAAFAMTKAEQDRRW